MLVHLCLAIGLASARPPNPVSAIRHLYALQNLAYARKDVGAFLPTVSPDYKMLHREHGEKLDNDRALVEQEMRSSFKLAIWQSRTTKLKLLSSTPGRATFAVKQHIRSKVRNMSTNGTYLLYVTTKGEDLWMKSPGGWKMRQSTIFSSSYGTKVVDKGDSEERPPVKIGGGDRPQPPVETRRRLGLAPRKL